MNTYLKLTIYTGILLLVPVYFWLVDYQWSLSQVGLITETMPMILLTWTGSPPYAIGTVAVLLASGLFFTRKYWDWRVVVAMCALSLGGTQAVKLTMKAVFQEPRPYVVALENGGYLEEYGYPPHSFYQQDTDTQAKIVYHTAYNTDSQILTQYQSTELGYSFPSGHTIFAAAWLLVWVGLLRGAWGFQAALTVWAAAMAYTRVRLGMHYPVDLFVSILLAWLIHVYLFAKILPRLQKYFQAA